MNAEVLFSCGVGRTARPVSVAGSLRRDARPTTAPQEVYLHNWDAPGITDRSRFCLHCGKPLWLPVRHILEKRYCTDKTCYSEISRVESRAKLVTNMITLNSKDLSLRDVHRLLGLQMQLDGSFPPLLSLEPLTEFEQQELVQIRNDFANYLTASKVSEGLVKALTTFPLLRLAGFYRFPIEMLLEEEIERITIEDEDTFITGRFDILAVNQTALAGGKPFWILVIESKNSSVATSAGLPQLLTYSCRSLEYQESVWGLVTNGSDYQFCQK